MQNKLLYDLGMHYELIRTIVEKRFELVKLDVAEGLSDFIGRALLLMVVAFICMIVYMCLMLLLGFWLANLLDSTIWAITIVMSFNLLILWLCVVLRNSLFMTPSLNLIYRLFFKVRD